MSFDRLAPHYRWMEFVLAGRKLQRCRTAFLEEVIDAENALIIGEGPGRFLSEFLRKNPLARVTCVDASARMLTCARQRIERRGLRSDRVKFQHADVLGWSPLSKEFDLIVTHFVLDCFRPDQLESITRRIADSAQSPAKWLVTDFQEPPHGLARIRARIILQLMYAFFRVATALPARSLTAPDRFLEQNGFRLTQRRVSEFGLLHTDLWMRGPAGASPSRSAPSKSEPARNESVSRGKRGIPLTLPDALPKLR